MKTIFINIAAYNDRQLFSTFKSAIINAKFPERLYFGVCWQGKNPLAWMPTNCRTFYLHLSEAKGVGFARWLAHGLYEGQDYYLQIDSHMKFAPEWDTLLEYSYLDNVNRLSNKIIYSHYCPGWSEYPKGVSRSLTAQKTFNQYGVLRFEHGKAITEDQIGWAISCHFIFGLPQFWEDVPCDPWIFYNGEEVSVSVRAWTHGYSVVHPGKPLIYHKYNGDKSHPVIWADNPEWSKLNSESVNRVQAICEGKDENFGIFGNGNKKNIQSLELITGINFKEKIVL